jgi:hypothetical protein
LDASETKKELRVAITNATLYSVTAGTSVEKIGLYSLIMKSRYLPATPVLAAAARRVIEPPSEEAML